MFITFNGKGWFFNIGVYFLICFIGQYRYFPRDSFSSYAASHWLDDLQILRQLQG
jgi:hypothetical protein